MISAVEKGIPHHRRFRRSRRHRAHPRPRLLRIERLEDRMQFAADLYVYQGHTYFLTTELFNFADAAKLASDLGGYLVSINNAAEQQFLSTTFPTPLAYVGLSDAAVEGTFRWQSNQALTYTNWSIGEPNDWQGNEDAVAMDSAGKWNDIPLSTSLQAIVEIPQLVKYYGGSLYLQSNSGLTWQQAESAALTLGGHLVSIGSSAEQDWLVDHYGKRAPFFTGLNDVATEGQFVWSDGTPNTYQNWAPGEPNNKQGIEDYVQFGWDGNWRAVGPAIRWSGIIEIPLGGNYRFLNLHEYRIDNNWQVWSAVRNTVLARGGDLAAVNSAAEQAFIEANMLNGSQYFIGLNDLAVEGKFGWSNGQSLGYANWNPGEPNDWQGNEDVVMIDANGKWNDVSSTSISQALQEYDWQRPNATVSASGITQPSADPYRFTVRVSDDVAVRRATLDNQDILVSGPKGYSARARLVSVDRDFDSPLLTATYEIDPPGSDWDSTDNGSYVVKTFRYELSDTSGNMVPSKVLGKFSVNVAARGTIAISTPEVFVTEGTAYAEVLVSRTGGSQGQISFDFTTSNATAIADQDYVRKSGIVIMLDGQTSATLRIPIIDDFDAESNETLGVSLDRVVGGAVLGTVRTAVVTILDNGDPVLRSGTGLRGQYYSNAVLGNLAVSRVDPQVNFDWGTNAPAPGIPQDQFSASWTGWLEPLYSENYVFELTVDDGVRFWLADQLLIDSWTVQSTTLQTVSVPLDGSRRYAIRIEYFDQADQANIAIRWSSARQTKELIPASQLYDGDSGPPITAWLRSSAQVDESQTNASVTVYRGGDTSLPLTVRVQSQNGTAEAGKDFQPIDQIVSFAPGETTTSLAIPLINDTVSEFNENFFLELSDPSYGSLGALRTMRIDIADDDLGVFATESVVTGLAQPTALDWSANGLMFIAQKSGVIRVFDGTNLLPQPFADLSDEVNDVRDRGMLGLAVHPNFPSQPYVYVAYTYDPPETKTASGLAAPDREGNRVARISRLTADATTNFKTMVSNSEFVLVGKNSTWSNISHPELDSTGDTSIPPSCGNSILNDCILTDSQSHTIGQLRFGLDGSLFASVGDGASYGRVDPRATRTTLLESLSGKMLRIDPITGRGLPDNPFYDGNPNSNQSKVDSLGFRNPFRFVIHPVTGDPYIGDVGWNTWEEINFGTGANFGWPYYEGGEGVSLRTNGYKDLPEAQIFYASGEIVAPGIIARNHADGAQAILAGDFYYGNVFPPVFQGGMIVGDINVGQFDLITFNDAYEVTGSHRFVNNQPGIVQVATGSDGLIYFVNLFQGVVGRWRPEITPQSFSGGIQPNKPINPGITSGKEVDIVQSLSTISIPANGRPFLVTKNIDFPLDAEPAVQRNGPVGLSKDKRLSAMPRVDGSESVRKSNSIATSPVDGLADELKQAVDAYFAFVGQADASSCGGFKHR